MLRGAIAVIHYMNHRSVPAVNQRLANVVNLVDEQWRIIETEWNRANPNDQVQVAAFWRE
jgi:hypothetical protein